MFSLCIISVFCKIIQFYMCYIFLIKIFDIFNEIIHFDFNEKNTV